MSWRDRILIFTILAAVVAVLFHESFKPGMVHFSSDGPLGLLAARDFAMPEGFKGLWMDSNWMGSNLGSPSPNFTSLFWSLLGPVGTAKFLAPLFVLSLGLGAAFCFRVFGFRPMVCLLGGLAAELNSNFFSNACWGVGTRCSSLAATFLAIAAVWSSRRGYRWLKLVLAGFATGMAVMEGADNGAIFSLFIAAFAFYVSLIDEGSWAKKIIRGAAMVAVVAAFAGFMAYQTVKSLVSTQITGIVGMEQNAEAKEIQWYKATQWSLPKLEMLRVIIPGVFGYRVDSPDGGAYWGRVGEWEPDPRQGPRSSGAGEYAGALVVLVAAWALARSFSRKAQTYSDVEKKVIWFWAAAGFVAALFAWGHHAPFYRLLYALPYFSTIRNPMKFMHPCHMTLLILFAYGLQGLAREFLEKARTSSPAAVWDKRWKITTIAAVVFCAIGWMTYSALKADVVRYMGAHFIPAEMAAEIAKFSVKEVGLFVLVLGVCVAAVLAVQAGVFRGPRAVWAGVVLGVVLVGDLWRANTPWINYDDYQARYETNPVFETLRARNWEHRVVAAPFQLSDAYAQFAGYFRNEWMQHQLQYYNIQMLETVHDGGRTSAEKEMYKAHLEKNFKRYWQLTNTRYIFGVPGLAEALNRDADPVNKSFRPHTAFTLFVKPGASTYTVQTNATGPFAMIEYTGTLPRAKLYSRWSVMTNNVATLDRLAAPDFAPETEVILADEIPAPSLVALPAEGTVEYTSYEPKRFTQRTSSAAASVLLVNDRYDADWKVAIDGQPAKVMRANFLMRAVQVPPGQHNLVWTFAPKQTALYVTITALVLATLLCGILAYLTRLPAAATGRK